MPTKDPRCVNFVLKLFGLVHMCIYSSLHMLVDDIFCCGVCIIYQNIILSKFSYIFWNFIDYILISDNRLFIFYFFIWYARK